jgi:hypothetical protein
MRQDTVYPHPPPPPAPQYFQTPQTQGSPHTLGTSPYHPYTNYPPIPQIVQRPSISKAIVRNNVIFKLCLTPSVLYLCLAFWNLISFILNLIAYTVTNSPLPVIDSGLRLLYDLALGAFFLVLAFKEDFLLSGSDPLVHTHVKMFVVFSNTVFRGCLR